MSSNYEKQKKIEELYTKRYFNKVYDYNPEYIDIESEIPDCYLEYNQSKIAVELTVYFMQKDEEEKVILKRSVSKLLEKDNWLYEAHKHLGKFKNDTINIHYRNKEDIISDILKAKKYIKHIRIGNNGWFYKENANKRNCYLMNCNRQKMSLEDFLESVNFINEDTKEIYIEVLTRKKYHFSARLKHNRYNLKNKNKCVDYSYVCWENEIEQYESLIKSIESKVNRYEEYEDELSQNNILFNKYILILYPEQFPMDIEDIEGLYRKLKEKIGDFKYDEIGIFVFNKILILRNKEYRICNKTN